MKLSGSIKEKFKQIVFVLSNWNGGFGISNKVSNYVFQTRTKKPLIS